MQRIAIVTDFWQQDDYKEGKPLSGTHGWLIRSMLKQVGISPSICTFHALHNAQRPTDWLVPRKDGVPGYRPLAKTKSVNARYAQDLVRLHRDLDREAPNVVVALGDIVMWALTRQVGLKAARGTIMEGIADFGRKPFKVIPTNHPASILANWAMRPITMADLGKALRQSESPDILRPVNFIHIEPTIADIESFYHEYLADQPVLSTDIETKQRTVTEIGFARIDGSRAIVIPFYSRARADGNYWRTKEEELEALAWVRHIGAAHRHVGQNFQYDMKYMWRTLGIPLQFEDDTMIMHHSLQPELQKGLGFLASIYTDRPAWKDMRAKNATLKKEDE